ncbi:MAG: SpoIIE family protein phosphatase, partial [candidate division Zixibacteria bacterium]|nr:SpoIIE family protein phosphatase [candidate division Zixibacteria bacterium]
AGDNFDIAAFSQPSRQVGGDYYDFFPQSDGSLGMVVADISGKGVGAALLVSQLQAILKAEVRTRGSLHTMITKTNALITESTAPDRFATLVYAEFDPDTLELKYCNAGHNYPIIVRADGQIETLETGGLLLGVSGHAQYQTDQKTLGPGDLVLFYTDGLSEINDPQGNEFGEKRLTEFLTKNRHLSVEDLKNRLVREVSQFALGEIGFDDLTLVILKIKADSL